MSKIGGRGRGIVKGREWTDDRQDGPIPGSAPDIRHPEFPKSTEIV